MSLNLTIEKAATIAGSQRALAETLGAKEQHVSNWKNKRRPCPIPVRMRLAEITGEDPQRAMIEGLLEQMDHTNPIEAGAAKMMESMLKAFPKERNESQHFRRRRVARGNHAVPGKARYFFAPCAHPATDEPRSTKHQNDAPWPTGSHTRHTSQAPRILVQGKAA